MGGGGTPIFRLSFPVHRERDNGCSASSLGEMGALLQRDKAFLQLFLHPVAERGQVFLKAPDLPDNPVRREYLDTFVRRYGE
jgi:hypothetical protein